jgi:hypothetical protein
LTDYDGGFNSDLDMMSDMTFLPEGGSKVEPFEEGLFAFDDDDGDETTARMTRALTMMRSKITTSPACRPMIRLGCTSRKWRGFRC